MDDHTPNVDGLVELNRVYADDSFDRDVNSLPSRRLVVVTCMDSRIDALEVFGLERGEAHILRNAGGVVTDDVIRSICLSQRFLGTREIILAHHTDCGLQKVDEAEFRNELVAEAGVAPSWSVETFDDPADSVRQSIERLRVSPFIRHADAISGFVYDVADGLLHEVTTES